jgi:putative ABC transport system permease protein
MRQLLTESVILSMIGGALGLLIAMWGIDLLVAFSPGDLPRMNEVRLDRWVLAFTFGVSALTGVLFGLAPAIHASRVDINEALKEGGSKAKTGFGYRSLRSLLIVSEVALALVLLIGAGLLIKSFVKIREIHPGFNAENVLSLSLDLPTSKYGKKGQKTEFYNQAIERISALPGVQSVGAASSLPMGSETHMGFQFSLEGETGGFDEKRVATYTTVTPDYFRAMGIPLLAGRYFMPEDQDKSTPVVIVTQTLAQQVWPNDNPVGKKIVTIGKQTREIVGVVGDVKSGKLEGDIRSGIYAPHTQSFFGLTTMAIRTASGPSGMIAGVRAEIQAIDKDLPLYDIKTMEQRLSDVVAERRFTLVLLGTFAALALTLAAIGIYGVMSYSVSQRTREIGIRMALGARRGDVLKLILRRGLVLTLVGVGVGLTAAYAATRIMTTLLYEVSPTDTWTFIIVSLVLAAVALAATFVPARRATKVDPMIALRYE